MSSTSPLYSARRPSRRRWVLGIGIAFGAGACCIVLAIAALFWLFPSRTQSTASNAAPALTSTPRPSRSPAPTRTGTPLPSPTAEESPTYAKTAGAILLDYVDQLTILAKVGDDPALLFDLPYRVTLTQAFAKIRENADALALLEPPPGYEGMHKELLEAASNMRESADLMEKSIDAFDGDLMEQSNQKMKQAAAALTRAFEIYKSLPGAP